MGKMEFFSNYLSDVVKTPNEDWRNTQQAFIDEMIDNSTIYREDVFEEGYPFDFTFVNNPLCWVSTVIDVTTGAIKNSDDYRSLYFKDIEHESGRGRYFKWHDNYWIVYETTTHELETISTCNIRRCNNWLKWVTDKGELMQYPCVIEGELTSANAQVAKTITQANSHINVIVQGNPNTLKIKKNDRFYFNGNCYRFYAINDYMQVDYIDENCPMLFMDFYLDMTIDEDNIKENIANDIRNRFKVECKTTSVENVVGYEGDFICNVYKDNELIQGSKLEYTSTNEDVITIDSNGRYELVSEGDSIVIIQIQGNPKSAITIPITVTDTPSITYKLVVSPIIESLKQGRSVYLEAQVLDNSNNVISTDITLTVSGGDSNNNYSVIDNNDNTWILKNELLSKLPITLTFDNSEYDLHTSMEVQLKAMF